MVNDEIEKEFDKAQEDISKEEDQNNKLLQKQIV